MNGYSKWHPFRVHMVNGQPVIYNKLNKPIRYWDAQDQFTKAVNTAQTWGLRLLYLAAEIPDTQQRTWVLEQFQWKLTDLSSWVTSMQQALDKARGGVKAQETIDKLLALAESTTFPEEADTARRLAARRQKDEQ